MSLLLERFTYKVTEWAGSARAFALALIIVLVWAATGPVFRFSDTWQLVINTGTTIITFLMVFLIQRSQNKESMAVQVKLNEIIAALRGASNRLINVESLSEQEVRELHARYQVLAEKALHNPRHCRAVSSIEEASAPAPANAADPAPPSQPPYNSPSRKGRTGHESARGG
jgi:low affinity Fe/Cu permease